MSAAEFPFMIIPHLSPKWVGGGGDRKSVGKKGCEKYGGGGSASSPALLGTEQIKEVQNRKV